MNELKSSFTKTLDFIRNILIILTTIYLVYLLWYCNWVIALISSIPLYIILLNLYGFLTLPFYFLSPEGKMTKYSKEIFNEYGIDIENEAKELLKMFPDSNASEFSPTDISTKNFEKATECVKDILLNKDNDSVSYCKSYKSLNFSKESIELAFNYLLDSIKFDRNCPIYQNKDFALTLQEQHMKMLLTYVNEEPHEIPEKLTDQIKFVSERKINLEKNQVEITKLINWRNDEQWKYYLKVFGSDSELGKICISKME